MSISRGGNGPRSSKRLGRYAVGKVDGDGRPKNSNQLMMGRTLQSANKSKSQQVPEGAAGEGIGGSGGRWWGGEGGRGGYEAHPIDKASGEIQQF
jgi:hypothetical protein